MQALIMDPGKSQRVSINSRVSFVDCDGVRTVWWGWQPLLSYPHDDKLSERFAVVQLARHKAAFMTELARGFGVHLNTVRRWVDGFASHRIAGLVDGKRGPQGPHKLTPAIEQDLKAWFASGRPIGKALVAAIEAAHGVRMHPETFRKLGKAWRQPSPVLKAEIEPQVVQLVWEVGSTSDPQPDPPPWSGSGQQGEALAAMAETGPERAEVRAETGLRAPADAAASQEFTGGEEGGRQDPARGSGFTAGSGDEGLLTAGGQQHLAALGAGIHTPYAGAFLIIPFLQSLGLVSLITGQLGQLPRSRPAIPGKSG